MVGAIITFFSWLYMIDPPKSYGYKHIFPWFFLISGILASLALYYLVNQLIHRRKRLEELASKRSDMLMATIKEKHQQINDRKKAESALNESEKRFQQFVEISHAGVWVIDDNYKTTYANPRMAQMLGYNLTELLCNDLFCFIDMNAKDKCLSFFESSKKGVKQSCEFEFKHKNGHTVYGAIEAAAFVDEENNKEGFIVDIIDITKRKIDEERLNRELLLNFALAELSGKLLIPNANIEDIAKSVLDYALKATRSAHGYVAEISNGNYYTGHSMTEMFYPLADTDNGRLLFIKDDLLCRYLNPPETFYTNWIDVTNTTVAVPDGLNAFLSVPAFSEDMPVGQVVLANPDTPYNKKDIDDIRRVSTFFAISIMTFRRKKALEESRFNLEVMVKERTDELVKTNKELEEEIGERIKFENTLQESEARFRKLFEESPIGIATVSFDFNIAGANKILCEMTGFTEEELKAMKTLELTHKEDVQPYTVLVEQLKNRQIQVFQMEKRVLSKNASVFWCKLTVSLIYDDTYKGLYFIEMVENITRTKEIEQEKELLSEKIEQQAMLLDEVLSNTPYQIFMIDKDGKYIYANNSATRLIGKSMDEIVGKTWQDLDLPRKIMRRFDVQRNLVISSGQPLTSETEFLTDTGTTYLEYTISPIVKKDGSIESLLVTVKDITDRRSIETRLRFLSFYDSLTGLPNRVLFNDRLLMALTHAQRQQVSFAIIIVDIDNFKDINDTMGHDTGDKVLSEMSIRLKECLREEDTIARVSGDEFAMLITNANSIHDIIVVTDRIISKTGDPLFIDERDLYITLSMGICLYPSDGNDTRELMKNAEVAMYEAKSSGRNNYKFFTHSMNEMVLERMDLGKELRYALENDEFILNYQPQVDLAKGNISGMEALIRWQNPKRGLIFPDKFIPIAEETGLINSMSEWVVKKACADCLELRQLGLPPIQVAVNISMQQFNLAITDVINNILNRMGFDPSFLELEITESIFMKNQEVVVETLYQLKKLGICISIDDFGTGYSSLAYLKNLPIDKLKIDRSFIMDLPDNKEDTAIVRTIITMAKNLEMNVIAEGVETIDQLELLRSFQCNKAQGYLFSRPVHLDEIKMLLENELSYINR